MNTSIAIQILPLSVEKKQLLQIVDEVIEFIRNSGCHYEVSAFETTIEGEFEQVFDILKNIMLLAGENKDAIFANVKIMYQKTGVLTIDEKVQKHRREK